MQPLAALSTMTLDVTSNNRPRVVQELLDSILDHLYCDSNTLKQCALVSPSFLPTSQRHLFSTFKISKSNVRELVKLFRPPGFIDVPDYEGASDDSDIEYSYTTPRSKDLGRFYNDDEDTSDDEDASDGKDTSLRARVAYLLNTYTTDLTLIIHDKRWFKSSIDSPYLPKFKNLRRIVLKGEYLRPNAKIPPFLLRAWMSPTSKILSVGFDFRYIRDGATLESLYTLPVSVENVSFTNKEAFNFGGDSAGSLRDAIKSRLNSVYLDRGVRHFNGAVRFRLATDPYQHHTLEAMVELKEVFKFNLKRINYQLTNPNGIHPLALLVGECKSTLQSLDIVCLSSRYEEAIKETRSFDFSHHHALGSIRIWTPAIFIPEWIRVAISSIPKPSSTNPRVPPLRIELHISLEPWMMFQDTQLTYLPRGVDKIASYWIPVDAQLSNLIGASPEALPVTPLPGVTSAGITLDVSVTNLLTGPGNGIAALMFPILSNVEGLVRLV